MDFSKHVAVKIERSADDEIETVKRDFDLLDRKNRSIGYLWSIRPVTVRALSEDEKTALRAWNLVTADVVAMSTPVEVGFSVTRDGRSYGASNGTSYYGSRDLAMAAMEEKAALARKRYAAKERSVR